MLERMSGSRYLFPYMLGMYKYIEILEAGLQGEK